MGRQFRDLQIVGTTAGPDGKPVIVNCAIRERDVEPEVLQYLGERAREGVVASPLHPDFENSDALGG